MIVSPPIFLLILTVRDFKFGII
ncbi:hypothetical protein CHELA40_50780 [Chelatococcus asaccharovorans]|nr:hypothetical protein CHELA40_50780 [Chelatococcus asaccharovorans]